MIRPKFLKNLYETLGEHPNFDEYDFKITSENADETVSFMIIYNHLNQYRMNFNVSKQTHSSEGYRYVVGSYSPGSFLDVEDFGIRDVNDIYSVLTKWQNNLWEELAIAPVLRKIEEHDKKLEEIMARFDSVEDGHFSSFEESGLKSRLDDLEAKLQSEIKEREVNADKVEEEFEKLRVDIENLKATIASFNKKGWFKNFSSKMFKWTKDSENRKMLKDGYNLITEFLPENLGDII